MDTNHHLQNYVISIYLKGISKNLAKKSTTGWVSCVS